MLRRNMSTADWQKSDVEGKTFGLHSALFSERGDGNTRVNPENYGKNAKNRLQLVRLGELQVSPDELKAAILLFYGLLDEQQRRLFAGLESIRLGHGGDTLLCDILGVDVPTLARGRPPLPDQNVGSGRTRRTRRGSSPTDKK